MKTMPDILRHSAIVCAVVLMALTGAMRAHGQEQPSPERPVLSAYSAEFGTAHAADTYLSPLHYNGWHLGLGYERMQAMRFNPENWVMQLDAHAEADRMHNLGQTSFMWNFEVQARWAMMRRWRAPFAVSNLTLGIGPGLELRGGALYLRRNGNNPASAKGAITVGATAMAAYNLHLGKLPVTLRYECTLPVAGAFFAPDYGQLYYEIWLGERDGLAHAAWWGNYFRMTNLVTADLRFGRTTLRLGYSGEIISTKANHIVSRRVAHAFTLGVVTEWLSLPVRGADRQTNTARIISALY